MKSCLFICFLLSAIFLYSQDTIKFKTGKIQIATVSELTSKDVVYTKFDNPDRPSYRVAKADIDYIRYINGSRDFFIAADSPGEFQKSPVPENKIIFIDGHLFYNGKRLGEATLKKMVLQLPDKEKKRLIMRRLEERRDMSKLQYPAFIVGMICVCACPIVILTAFDPPGSDDVITGALIGGGTGVAAILTATHYKRKKFTLLKEIVAIYNL